MEQVIVYYDSACPVCSSRVAYYQRFDKKNVIIWQDVSQNRDGLEDKITNSRIGAYLHVRDRQGNLKKGINAYNTMWKELQNFFFLAFFTSLYSLKWLFIIAHAISWRVQWHLGKHKKYHDLHLI